MYVCVCVCVRAAWGKVSVGGCTGRQMEGQQRKGPLSVGGSRAEVGANGIDHGQLLRFLVTLAN